MRVRVCERDLLDRNGGLKVVRHPTRAGWSALVLLEGDAVVAIGNACPHHGSELTAGYRRKGTIECPLHGWRFDVVTGACAHPSDARIPTFAVMVEEGIVYVELPD
jgi:nitrite reductase/ring-hydroxylating ferredoxin subunit